jgi:hypothetical protein
MALRTAEFVSELLVLLPTEVQQAKLQVLPRFLTSTLLLSVLVGRGPSGEEIYSSGELLAH